MKFNPNFYPYEHISDSKKIAIDNLPSILKNIDFKNDNCVSGKTLEHLIRFGDPGTNSAIKEAQIAQNLKVRNTLPEPNPTLHIKEYISRIEKNIDSIMTSVLEQYKGPYFVGISGGIDSTLIAAWLYKNNVDFTAYSTINLPNSGTIADLLSQRMLKAIGNLGIKTITLDYSNQSILNWYWTNIEKLPVPCIGVISGDHSPQLWNMLKNGFALSGYGGNEVLLHSTVPAFGYINSKDYYLLRHLDWYKLTTHNYSSGREQKLSEFLFLANKNNYSSHHTGYPIIAHIIQKQQPKNLGVWYNKEWIEEWQSIKTDTIDLETFINMRSIKYLKSLVFKWTNSEITKLLHHGNGTENYITPNSANREYALKKLKEMKNVFTAPIIKKDILEYTLCLTKFNKITENAASLIHFYNWYQN